MYDDSPFELAERVCDVKNQRCLMHLAEILPTMVEVTSSPLLAYLQRSEAKTWREREQCYCGLRSGLRLQTLAYP
jgi:hypothetical protein